MLLVSHLKKKMNYKEMKVKGSELNDRGRWVDPVRLQESREGFAKAA